MLRTDAARGAGVEGDRVSVVVVIIVADVTVYSCLNPAAIETCLEGTFLCWLFSGQGADDGTRVFLFMVGKEEHGSFLSV